MAVVGCGYIGHRHIAMIEAHPEMELAAVADIRPAEVCDAPRGVNFYPTLEALLSAEGSLDVLSVCTPNAYHADMAVLALNRGLSVIIEKPMALSAADSLRVAEAEKRSRGRVFCVFQNRYTPSSAWLHGLIAEGRLGRIASVSVHCFWNRDGRYYKPGTWHGTADIDGGTLYTQFSHFVDILLWNVGPIDVTSATFGDFAHADSTDFEDTGAFIFRTRRDGAIGSFAYSTAVQGQNLESSITIIGTKGSVRISGQYMSDVEVCAIEGYAMPQLPPPNPPNDYGAYKGSAANHCYVFDNVADALLRGAKPDAPWADGHEVVDTIGRVYALRTGDYRSTKPLTYRP